MAQIQLLSDLHLEAPRGYDAFEITPEAPYLALLGDIGCIKDPEYFEFIAVQLSKFRVVFLLLGNHEPYHSSWDTAKKRCREFESENKIKRQADAGLAAFIFLDQTRYDISADVTVLGCTLYSKIIPEQKEMVSFGLNDFYYIEGWTVEDHSAAHDKDLQRLNEQVKVISTAEPHLTVIVFTHHSPAIAPQAVDPAHTESKISSGFATDLSMEDCWTSGNVKIWAFGHNHYNCDYKDTGTGKRVVTNQRGYYFKQAAGFDEAKVIMTAIV